MDRRPWIPVDVDVVYLCVRRGPRGPEIGAHLYQFVVSIHERTPNSWTDVFGRPWE